MLCSSPRATQACVGAPTTCRRGGRGGGAVGRPAAAHQRAGADAPGRPAGGVAGGEGKAGRHSLGAANHAAALSGWRPRVRWHRHPLGHGLLLPEHVPPCARCACRACCATFPPGPGAPRATQPGRRPLGRRFRPCCCARSGSQRRRAAAARRRGCGRCPCRCCSRLWRCWRGRAPTGCSSAWARTCVATNQSPCNNNTARRLRLAHAHRKGDGRRQAWRQETNIDTNAPILARQRARRNAAAPCKPPRHACKMRAGGRDSGGPGGLQGWLRSTTGAPPSSPAQRGAAAGAGAALPPCRGRSQAQQGA